jgi:hypothetical protein
MFAALVIMFSQLQERRQQETKNDKKRKKKTFEKTHTLSHVNNMDTLKESSHTNTQDDFFRVGRDNKNQQ